MAIGGDIIEVCSPFKPGTTVGRLLEKRGDGGYMVIMQTGDAAARRKYIESNELAQVIFSHAHDDVQCIQYHPKGILGEFYAALDQGGEQLALDFGESCGLTPQKGGMMPELDSHTPSPQNPTPLDSPSSPWHACGSDYDRYSAAMKRCSHLKLLAATCRLAPGQTDVEAAARQWQGYFGIASHGSELAFTNARLRFVPGVDGLPEGLESISIQVRGRERLEKMLDLVRKEGLCGDGWANLLGVKWYFTLEGDHDHDNDNHDDEHVRRETGKSKL